VRIVGDTCGVINAFKAGALDVVLLLENYEFILGPAVMAESLQLREVLEKHLSEGRTTLPDENLISATTVASISGNYNLGIGESECIAVCQADPSLNFWSDDRRARLVGGELLGEARIIGTADLFRACVEQALLSPLDAYTAYELARSRGAFLPALGRNDFDV
jgi:predicted nucleic acid-binding protein